MAIWQYDFIVVPRDELESVFGSSISRIPSGKIKDHNLWSKKQPIDNYLIKFTSWRSELKSWSTDLRMWGNEESNRIDVYYEANAVCHIEFRVELRSLSITFIDLLAEFARENNCAIISAHSLIILEPLRENILNYLCRSRGANNVWDWLNGAKEPKKDNSFPSVFLSHTSSDKAFVNRLAIDLRGKNVPVWFDKWELKVGDSLSTKISEGINNSGWLAVVLSKKSVESAWVQKELNAALARELRKKEVFVLPIIIDDCDVPIFLQDKVYADFRHSYNEGLDSLLNRITEGKA